MCAARVSGVAAHRDGRTDVSEKEPAVRRSIRERIGCGSFVFAVSLASLTLLASCSRSDYRYKSLRDGGYAEIVASRQRWARQLPDKPGKDLAIERADGDEVLTSDR